MRRSLRLFLLVVLIVSGSALATPAQAQTTPPLPDTCAIIKAPDATSLATWVFCTPPAPIVWNGEVVVFAHGYAKPDPTGLPAFENLTLPDGTSVPGTIMGLGFGFAATTYPKTGLAIKEGVQDVLALGQALKADPRVTGKIYLIGASEGGLVTTLTMEKASAYSGGLAACGPVGDFRLQTNYLGDFRVLYDYFFPGVLPNKNGASAINIPPAVMANWESAYVPTILARLQANPDAAKQLIRTTKAAVDPADPATVGATTVDVLWYNVFATNEAKMELGGNPFGNRLRLYTGSTNDKRLNLGVARFSVDRAAIDQLTTYYNTSGKLKRPLVTIHTVADPVVPFWHEGIYAAKTLINGHPILQIPIFRYGHCAFTPNELLSAFGLLYLQVNGHQPAGLKQKFSADQVQRDWQRAQSDPAARTTLK